MCENIYFQIRNFLSTNRSQMLSSHCTVLNTVQNENVFTQTWDRKLILHYSTSCQFLNPYKCLENPGLNTESVVCSYEGSFPCLTILRRFKLILPSFKKQKKHKKHHHHQQKTCLPTNLLHEMFKPVDFPSSKVYSNKTFFWHCILFSW